MSEIINTVTGTYAAIIPADGQTHYDFGIMDERDRIVALLEAELGPDFAGDSTAEPKDAFLSVKWLVALIKGENE
jgi:hypothetical protein